VVPAHATAIINHRVHPSQTISQVIEFDKRTIDDPRVEIKVKTSKEAHPVSPYSPDDVQYNLIATSIYQTFEDAVVIPGKIFILAHLKPIYIFNLKTNYLLCLLKNKIYGYNY